MKEINLFVIDELPIIQKISTTLHSEDLGISVVDIARTEEEALQKIKEIEHIDVLLTRPINPNTITAIKQQFPKIKVIGMTEKSQMQVDIEADVWIKKPFKLRYLIETIEKVTEKEEETERVIDQQYKALSDATRRQILDLLQNNPRNAGELAELCQTTKPNISQHLKVLKNSGLVQEEKKGLYVYYSLSRFDFQQAKKEVGLVLNIKEKILYDIQQIAYKKNCEPVVGATDSQDDGTFYMMKDAETLISFHYSFRLSSFFINFEIPTYLQKGGSFHLRYDDTKGIEDLYQKITEELQQYIVIEEKKKETNEKLRYEVKKYMVEKTRNMDIFLTKDENILHQLHSWVSAFIKEKGANLSLTEQSDMIQEVILELTSLDKIHSLMEDPTVAEIMINAPGEVWIEQKGKLVQTDIAFANHDEVMYLARKIAGHVGRRIDNSSPFLHTKLPDGSSVQIILPPITVKGVNIFIRKFHQERLTVEELIRFNTVTKEAADFLKTAIDAKGNILISGGVGAGKNTTLNVLSQLISNDERIVTIEDNTELQLTQGHVVKMETRPANAEGLGGVSLRDCMKAASKLRPDRIVIGEIIDGVAHDVVQACLTGHHGLMATIYANNARGALERMHNFITYAGFDYPFDTIQHSIGEAIDLVVQVARLRDGSRKITEITQVVGYNRMSKELVLQPIYKWQEEGKENGKITGKLVYTGRNLSEKLLEKLEYCNIPDPLAQLSIKGTEKEIEQIETAIPLLMEQLADALRSGHTLNEAVRYVHDTTKNELTTSFYEMVKDTKFGVERVAAFEKIKQQYDTPQLHLLLHAMMIEEVFNEPLEVLIRRMQSILQERNEILRGKSTEERQELFASDDWQFTEFLDLLSCVTLSTGSLEKSIELVCGFVDNLFSRNFYQAVKEIKAGKTPRMAYTDLAERMANLEVQTFVAQIKQSEVFGSNIDQTIQREAVKRRNFLKARIKGY